MNSPLYHDPYHHYDPTIINTHTLLKPRAYPHPPSINTHISPPPTYPNSIDSSSLHSLIRHINYATEQLRHFHRACIHSISSFASEISSLNHNLIAPNFTYQQQQPIIPSTTVFNQNFDHHYHDPFPPPKSTPFNHPNFTYNNIHSTQQNTPVFHKPFNHQQPHKISTIPDPIFVDTEEPKEFVAENFKDLDRTILSDPVSQFIGKQQVFVNKDINVVAPSNLVLDSTTNFSIETGESSSDDIVTVKDLEDHRDVPPSISQSPCDSDGVESLTIQSIVDVPIGLVPTKHRSIFPTRPLLLPYRVTVLTNKDGNTMSRATKREVPNHMILDNNFEHSFDFPVECTFNFDPGGDEHRVRYLAAILGNGACVFDPGGNERNFGSPVLISISNHGTQSPRQVPWDRGKNWGFQLPISGDGLISGNYFIAGERFRFWLAMQLNELKMTSSVITTAKQVTEEKLVFGHGFKFVYGLVLGTILGFNIKYH